MASQLVNIKNLKRVLEYKTGIPDEEIFMYNIFTNISRRMRVKFDLLIFERYHRDVINAINMVFFFFCIKNKYLITLTLDHIIYRFQVGVQREIIIMLPIS